MCVGWRRSAPVSTGASRPARANGRCRDICSPPAIRSGSRDRLCDRNRSRVRVSGSLGRSGRSTCSSREATTAPARDSVPAPAPAPAPAPETIVTKGESRKNGPDEVRKASVYGNALPRVGVDSFPGMSFGILWKETERIVSNRHWRTREEFEDCPAVRTCHPELRPWVRGREGSQYAGTEECRAF